MNILLFGPPGAGKGTQSELLVKNLRMQHISTGDIFRNAIKNDTELGNRAKTYMNEGKLVPDEIVIQMVKDALASVEGNGFILDGFPRTECQAKSLELMLQKSGINLEKAIFLEISKSKLVSRLTGRRVCKSCGAVFHIESKPSKKGGICDVCGGMVIQRPDDNEEVIRTRLDEYDKNTAPLREFYKGLGKYVEVNGDGQASEIYDRIVAIIREN